MREFEGRLSPGHMTPEPLPGPTPRVPGPWTGFREDDQDCSQDMIDLRLLKRRGASHRLAAGVVVSVAFMK